MSRHFGSDIEPDEPQEINDNEPDFDEIEREAGLIENFYNNLGLEQ